MSTSKRKELEEAIEALETQRKILGDAVVNLAIAAMQKQLAELGEHEPATQQRKLMTVLFMDVVNSTRMMRELDPEENLAIMDAALQKLAKPVETHGGRVTRFMGDGFLAVFGLPIARENDPEMAVRAGLGILETTRAIANQLEKEWGLQRFQVRVGVNTGLVVAGGVTEAEDTFSGNAINLAARLEKLAPPDRLLISQHTYQHVRGLFDLEPVEPIEVRGFPDPIQIFLVDKAKPSAFRVMSRGIEGLETHMVGRDTELNTLKEAFGFILQEKTCRFVTVVGEAGLGKSRLLYEFERWLEKQKVTPEFFKGRATLEIMGLPYRLLRNLIAACFGILDDDLIPTVRTKVVEGFRDALGELPNLEMNATIVGHLLGYNLRDSPYLQGMLDNPKQMQDLGLLNLARYFKSLATENPVVIFLDDVHWADESSLDLIHRLSREISNEQVLILALARPSLFERRPSWGNEAFQQRIDLQPLSPGDCKRLVQEVLQKVQNIPELLSNLIVSNSDGNPYYLEELVKMLIEDEVIVRGSDHWEVVPELLKEVHVPETLTGVLQARIEHLPAAERVVLEQAAVVGRIFWDDLLRYINEFDDKHKDIDLWEVLTALRGRELIFQRESSSFANAVEHIFKHAILREVTYESVLKRIRQFYHELIAEWLIGHSGERVEEVAGLIAGHLENAGKKAEALDYMCQAADAALSNYAIDEAFDYYNRALKLAPEKDLERQYTLMLGKETVLSIQGNRDEQKKILGSLAAVAEGLEDDRKRVEVLIRSAWLSYWTSEFAEMFVTAQQALNKAQTVGDQGLTQQATYATAWGLFQQNDLDGALKYANEALSLAQHLHDRRGEGNTFNILGLIKIAQSDFYQTRGYLEKFLSIAREIGDRYREMTAINNLGAVHTRLGDFPTAEDYFQQQMEIAQEIGHQVMISSSLVNLAWVKSLQEDWKTAQKYAEEGLVIKRKVGQKDAVGESLVWLGHSWIGLNQPEKAAAAYQEALDIRRELNQTSLAMGALAGLARAALAQGNLSTALTYTDEIAAYLAKGGDLEGSWEPLRIYLTCYQVFQQMSDPRAIQILKDAHAILQEDTSRILDEADQRLFLENIPWHREIMRIWQEQEQA